MEGLIFVAEAAEVLEEGAGEGGIVGEGRDGHEATDGEVGERSEGGEECGEIGGVEAVLGVFGRELDFDEDGEGFVEGWVLAVQERDGVIESGGGLEGVDRVDGGEEFGGF